MKGNAYYSNKRWARKAITILIDRTVIFETVERRENERRPFGEYQLGLKFFIAGQGTVTIWPTCESDLNEIRALTSTETPTKS